MIAFRAGIGLALSIALVSCGRQPASDPNSASSSTESSQTLVSEPVRHFYLPTANTGLLEDGAEERYFTPTVGRTWPSGTFGCVRSEGYQFHEGLDIRPVERDAKGEALDPILAAADGTVAYVNPKAGLSNYGIYLVLRHYIQGWEIYTLYAHLAELAAGIAPGQTVKAGHTLGIMGRTANTRDPISRERAHLHFEINLLVNEHFSDWHQKHFPGQRDDHGMWNGRNLLGIDPRAVLLQQHHEPASFDLGNLIQNQPVLCRTLVRSDAFPWLQRYPLTVQASNTPPHQPIVAYELHHNFLGIPLLIIPRTAEEAPHQARFQLLEVYDTVARDYPCQKMVRRQNSRWQLTPEAERFLDLLIL